MKIKTYINLVLAILFTVIVFHGCIMLKLIPYNIAWGGNLTNDRDMYVFEISSILINLFLTFIVLLKGKYMKINFNAKFIDITLWIFFGIFILNTIGNIFAKTTFEKMFSLITLSLAVLIWLILRKK